MPNAYENQFPPLPAPVRDNLNREIVSNPVSSGNLVARANTMSSYNSNSNQISKTPTVNSEQQFPSYQFQDTLFSLPPPPSESQWSAREPQSHPTVNLSNATSAPIYNQFHSIPPFSSFYPNVGSERGSIGGHHYYSNVNSVGALASNAQSHGFFERDFPFSSPSVSSVELRLPNDLSNCDNTNYGMKIDMERLAVGNGRPTKNEKKIVNIIQLLQGSHASGNYSNSRSYEEPGHHHSKIDVVEGIGVGDIVNGNFNCSAFKLPSSKPFVRSCGTQTDGQFIQSLDDVSYGGYKATQSGPEGTYQIWHFPNAHSSTANARFSGMPDDDTSAIVGLPFRQSFPNIMLVNNLQFPSNSQSLPSLPTSSVTSHNGPSDNQGKCRNVSQNLQVILAQMQMHNTSPTVKKPLSSDTGNGISTPATVPSSFYGTGKGCVSSFDDVQLQWNNKVTEPKKEIMDHYSSPASSNITCPPPDEDLRGPLYSRKIFVGGLSREMGKEDLMNGFHSFGITDVTWCSRVGGDSLTLGCAFVILRTRHQVKALLKTCTPCRCSHTGNDFWNGQPTWHYRLPFRNMRPVVEVIVWDVYQNLFSRENLLVSNAAADGYSVFVGNVHGRLTAKDLATIFYKQGLHDVKFVKIGTDRWEYPVGYAKVTFTSYKSFIEVIKNKRLTLNPPEFHRRSLQLEPFIDGNKCSSCKEDSAISFCKEDQCCKYFCRACFYDTHQSGNFRGHKDFIIRDNK